MAAPGTAYDDDVLGKDPQPAHMDDYVVTSDDNGGVHINSGIPNHAFYLAATRSAATRGSAPDAIWYETARDRGLRSTATFTDFARITVAVAGQLFGAGGAEEAAVRGGWDAVGVAWT